ncbi:MAG: flippase-like domain-containing protein [Bacteroidales bacterium]|nr:flippase-like domain-containing protein [Bacteroidales bacterium]
MNRKLVKALQFIFFLLVGLTLLYFAFSGIDLKELMLQIKQADYRWVAFSVLFAVLALIFRAYRWRLLLAPMDMRPKVSHIFHAINIGYLANFVFPRIGEITRCGVLNRTDKLPVDRVFGTVIVERIFDMLMAVLMLLLILLLKFDMVGGFITHHIFDPVIERIPGKRSIIWIVIIFVLTILAFVLIWKIFRTQLAKITMLRKIKGWLTGIFNGIKSIYKMKSFGTFLLLNIIIFAMYFLQTYVMFFSLNVTSSLGLSDALFILVLSTLSFVIPVQGGIGAYHWIVSMGLTIFGLSREDGMVYATISHSTTSLVLIILGSVSLIFVFYSKKFRNNHTINISKQK